MSGDLIEIIRRCRVYVEAAKDRGESTHDTEGDFKDDYGQWVIAQKAQSLLDEIDAVLRNGKKSNVDC